MQGLIPEKTVAIFTALMPKAVMVRRLTPAHLVYLLDIMPKQGGEQQYVQIE